MFIKNDNQRAKNYSHRGASQQTFELVRASVAVELKFSNSRVS